MFETEEKGDICCFGRAFLCLPSPTSNVEFHVLGYCAQH